MNTVAWTALRSSLLAFLALLPIGCGGSVEEAPTQTPDAGSDQLSDALQEKKPCNPFGTWVVTYEIVDAGYCNPIGGDTISVEKDGDAGGVVVRWDWDSLKHSDYGCGGDDHSTYSNPASLSADGCTLTAASHASWCMMGEVHCDNRDLTLTIQGNSASGVLTSSACWCPGPGQSTPTQYAATAVRE